MNKHDPASGCALMMIGGALTIAVIILALIAFYVG